MCHNEYQTDAGGDDKGLPNRNEKCISETGKNDTPSQEALKVANDGEEILLTCHDFENDELKEIYSEPSPSHDDDISEPGTSKQTERKRSSVGNAFRTLFRRKSRGKQNDSLPDVEYSSNADELVFPSIAVHQHSKITFHPDVSLVKIELEADSQDSIKEIHEELKSTLAAETDTPPKQLTRESKKRPGNKKVKKKIKKANEELFKAE